METLEINALENKARTIIKCKKRTQEIRKLKKEKITKNLNTQT